MAKKILNVIIILITLAILIFAGIWLYDWYRKYETDKANQQLEVVMEDTMDYVDAYLEQVAQQEEEVPEEIVDNGTETTTTTKPKKKKVASQIQYNDYVIVGKIVIKKIKLSYPILGESTVGSLKMGITKQYGVAPNKMGTMVLAGHNYRNGTMFSNLKKLVIGDIVEIIDLSGTTVQYSIYDIYETTPEDTAHLVQDTSVKRLVLTTCTNDSKKRIIIKCEAVE